MDSNDEDYHLSYEFTIFLTSIQGFYEEFGANPKKLMFLNMKNICTKIR